jgi:hypothetical protein
MCLGEVATSGVVKLKQVIYMQDNSTRNNKVLLFKKDSYRQDAKSKYCSSLILEKLKPIFYFDITKLLPKRLVCVHWNQFLIQVILIYEYIIYRINMRLTTKLSYLVLCNFAYMKENLVITPKSNNLTSCQKLEIRCIL